MTLIESFNSLIGRAYTPVTYSVTEGDAVVDVIATGAAGIDWPYVACALLVLIVIYSFFRLIGGMLR